MTFLNEMFLIIFQKALKKGPKDVVRGSCYLMCIHVGISAHPEIILNPSISMLADTRRKKGCLQLRERLDFESFRTACIYYIV
jgi:hypothetical protein